MGPPAAPTPVAHHASHRSPNAPEPPVYSAPVSDHPPVFGQPPDPRLLGGSDLGVKLPGAIDAVAHIAGADVGVVGAGAPPPKRSGRSRVATGGGLASGLARLGAHVSCADAPPGALGLPDDSADVVLGAWTVYRGVDAVELAEADRILRPGGRLVVVHDYGRDDLSRLTDPDRPEVTAWSRRGGPFLSAGFKIRVVHSWISFETIEAATETLGAAFGAAGLDLAATLKRPRLSDNLAVYHRISPAA